MFKRATTKAQYTLHRIHDWFHDKLNAVEGSSNLVVDPIAEANYRSTLARLIERLVGMPEEFKPLYDAVDGISIFFDRSQIYIQGDVGYLGLVKNLSELLAVLNNHLDQHQAGSSNVPHLAWGINREIQLLLELLKEEHGEHHPSTPSKQKEVMSSHRRIQALLARFILTMNSAHLWPQTRSESQGAMMHIPHLRAAEYNSLESQSIGRTGCAPDTRIEMMQQLKAWTHDCSSRPVQWITGLASMGKTTIAYSLCEYLDSHGLLAASFFCSEKLGCSQGWEIPTAITHQLAKYSPAFQSAVSELVRCHPEILGQPVAMQVIRLLVIPLRKVGHTLPAGATIILDGLNECKDAEEVIQLLSEIIKNSSHLPVKFLFTSRTGLHTEEMKHSPGVEIVKSRMFLDAIDIDLHKDGVESFLRPYHEQIRSFINTPTPISKLETKSFTYATTLVRYITGDLSESTQTRLERVQTTLSEDHSDTDVSSLGRLYTMVLLGTLGVENAGEINIQVLDSMHVLACARQPLTWQLLASLSGLEITLSLQGALLQLRKALYGVNDSAALITVDESFSQYLFNATLSRSFYCDSAVTNSSLAQACFDLMKSKTLSYSICKLQSSLVPNHKVAGLAARASEAISSTPLYACQNWSNHLCNALISEELIGELHCFLSERLLFWLEVVSLTVSLSCICNTVSNMQQWKQVSTLPEGTQILLRDALAFIQTFLASGAFECTPQLYLSTLSFWPTDRPVSKHYKSLHFSLPALECITLVGTTGDQAEHYTSVPGSAARAHLAEILPQTISHHNSGVNCVTYSPNGAYLASGANDHTICIWDSHTSWLVGKPLMGHTRQVQSVAYSLDGACIVSGSGDKTVRTWSTHTGQQVSQPLTGHTDGVHSVAYSADGAHIVSGSYDKTIRIWDVHTSQQVGQQTTDHTSMICSVSYSPDGEYFASCSWDQTIRISSAKSGQQVGRPLTGHTDQVSSIAYSPDGVYVASGSWDKTIRIWDVQHFIHQVLGIEG